MRTFLFQIISAAIILVTGACTFASSSLTTAENLSPDITATSTSINPRVTPSPTLKILPTKNPWQLASYLELENQFGRGLIQQLSFSPDGTALVVLSKDGVWVLDRVTSEVIYSLQNGNPTINYHYGIYADILWSPDGTSLAITNKREGIWIWSIDDWSIYTEGPTLGNEDEIKGSSWSPDGSQLIIETKNQYYKWNKNTNSWVDWIEKTGDPYSYSNSIIGSLKWIEDEKIVHVRGAGLVDIETDENLGLVPHWIDGIGRLVWGPGDSHIYELFDLGGALIDLRSEERVYGCCNEIAWSHDGRYLAAINRWEELVVQVIDTDTNEVVEEYNIGEPIFSLVWDEQNRLFASGVLESEIVLYEISTLSVDMNLDFYDHFILSSTNTNPTIYTFNSHKMALWNSETLEVDYSIELPQGYLVPQNFNSNDPDIFSVIDENGVLHIWHISNGALELTLSGNFPQVEHLVEVDFDRNVAFLVIQEDWNSAVFQIWDIESTKMLFEKMYESHIHDISLSPNKHRLLISFSPFQAVMDLFDIKEIKFISNLNPPHPSENSTVGMSDFSFSPSGESLAIINSRMLSIWDSDKGMLIDNPAFQDLRVRKAIWTRDEKKLLIFGSSYMGNTAELIIWDIEENNKNCSILLLGEVLSVANSPSGDRVAVGFREGILSIYDISTCYEVGRETVSDRSTYVIVWSDDGAFLYTNSEDGTVKVWKVNKD